MKGFTLVELMIIIAIICIALLAVSGLYKSHLEDVKERSTQKLEQKYERKDNIGDYE